MMDKAEHLDAVYRIRNDLKYTVTEDGIVTVYEKQNHRIQKFLRKLGAGIPEEKSLELDAFASFVFTCIDGEKTVREIAGRVKEAYGEKAEPLYERLLLFFRQLQNTYGYIERIG